MNESTMAERPVSTRVRRITDVLYNYWEEKRGSHPYPCVSDIDPEELADVWSNCFIVQLHHIQHKENYNFTYFGEALQRAYTHDLTDTAVKYVVSPHADHLACQYEKVLKTGKPLIDGNAYENRDHIKVLYRQVLLPLRCNDSDEVGFVLGGMRYKLKP